MKRILGDDFRLFEQSLNKPSPTSIRLNPFKGGNTSKGEHIPWCPDALYLETRPEFVYDPLWHAGQYYVQEAGSMFAGFALAQLLPKMDRPIVLDLCAAPGGKSTHLATALYGKGLLVSNEVIKHRLHILQENITKWGLPNVLISHQDPSQFSKLENFFDVILVDAPCSGEGLFRKQPEAMLEWSENQVSYCSIRQKKIVDDILPSLKPGGYLIYSTCTYNPSENEEIVRYLCDVHELVPVSIPIPDTWNITKNGFSSSFRFYPHTTQSEGLFLTVLKKEETAFSRRPMYVKKPYFSWPRKEEKTRLSDWFNMESMILKKQPNGIINLLLEDFKEEIEFIADRLQVVQAGTEVVEAKGKDLNPTQGAANSILLHKEMFLHVDLDLEQALAFLSKQALDSQGPLGLNLMTYEDQALGWAKRMSNRINNYYPQEWRIRQTKK
jgi:16S rRNA C967 or C1407 C5-methylase (RsmB/RsmF family)/NOL1/NOP2/fmu family ribosome biogenesis protein